MEDYVIRMHREYEELADKISKLKTFVMEVPVFKTLSELEQYRMIKQLIAMESYLSILGERIQNINN